MSPANNDPRSPRLTGYKTGNPRLDLILEIGDLKQRGDEASLRLTDELFSKLYAMDGYHLSAEDTRSLRKGTPEYAQRAANIDALQQANQSIPSYAPDEQERYAMHLLSLTAPGSAPPTPGQQAQIQAWYASSNQYYMAGDFQGALSILLACVHALGFYTWDVLCYSLGSCKLALVGGQPWHFMQPLVQEAIYYFQQAQWRNPANPLYPQAVNDTMLQYDALLRWQSEALRQQGMQAYAQGNYVAAAAALEQYVTTQGEQTPEAIWYVLGLCNMQLAIMTSNTSMHSDALALAQKTAYCFAEARRRNPQEPFYDDATRFIMAHCQANASGDRNLMARRQQEDAKWRDRIAIATANAQREKEYLRAQISATRLQAEYRAQEARGAANRAHNLAIDLQHRGEARAAQVAQSQAEQYAREQRNHENQAQSAAERLRHI